MRIIEGFCVREFLDEIIAIPTGAVSEQFFGIVSMNPIGQFLFNLLSRDQTEESLVEAVTAEYEVDEATARQDIRSFLEELRSHKLLVE